MIAFATETIAHLTVNSLTKAQLESAWEASCLGLNFAVNFVKNNASIDSPTLLSSPFLLITLSFYGYKRDYHLTAEDDTVLRFWTLVSNAKGQIFPRFQ